MRKGKTIIYGVLRWIFISLSFAAFLNLIIFRAGVTDVPFYRCFLVFAPVVFMFGMLNMVYSSKHEEYRITLDELPPVAMPEDNSKFKLPAVHEAGHCIIADKLGYEVTEVNILDNGFQGGCTFYNSKYKNPSDLKNMVLFTYSGLFAELYLCGYVTTGSFAGDFIKANEVLKNYIILTEDLSFTGFEENTIKSLSIKYSKEWKKEAEELVVDNLEDIQNMANLLIKQKRFINPMKVLRGVEE